MKPLYVIVHASLLIWGGLLDAQNLTLVDRLKSSKRKRRDEIVAVVSRLREIRENEDHIIHEGPYDDLPEGLPAPQEGREIKVCGVYRDRCVSFQNIALRKAGYNSSVDEKASLTYTRLT